MSLLGLFFLLGCELRDQSFQLVRTFPGGSVCEVFPDGGWIAADQRNAATAFSADGKVLWAASGYYNHQIRLDDEGNILLLKNELVEYGGEKVRVDVVEKRSRSGELLASWRAWDHILELADLKKPGKGEDAPFRLARFPDLKRLFGADAEATHVNAIHAIPGAARRRTHGAVYVVSESLVGACVGLSRDLQKILWAYSVPRLSRQDGTLIHDCQVDERGDVYYFDNAAVELSSGMHGYKVFLRDPKNRVLFAYPKTDEGLAVAQVHGGIQKLPDGWLISVDLGLATREGSDANSKAFAVIVDSSGNEKRRFLIGHSFQELRLVKYPKP